MTSGARLARRCVAVCTRNLGLKVLSLAFAISLFALVSGAKDAQRSVYVGVVALLPPHSAERVLLSELPDKVRLTLRGSRSLLQTLQPRHLSPVQINLRRTTATNYYFDLADFTIPSGLTIVQLAPASIPLVWAKRLERRIPIEVQTVGTMADGLAWQTLRIEPPGVWLRGPEPRLQALRSWPTEPLDASRLPLGDSEHILQLQQPPAHSQLLQDSTVRVTLRVAVETDEVTFTNLQVGLPVDHPPGRLRPAQVAVTLRGPKRRIDALAGESIKPLVDPQRATLALRLPVQVSGLPVGVQLVRIEPPTVGWRPNR